MCGPPHFFGLGARCQQRAAVRCLPSPGIGDRSASGHRWHIGLFEPRSARVGPDWGRQPSGHPGLLNHPSSDLLNPMESYFEDQRGHTSARDALDVIGNDRGRVGDRMSAETWWGAPAQGFAAALLVVGPAAGFQWAWLFFLASTLVSVGVEVFFRRRSGLSISRPAGPRGRALLIGIVFLHVVSLGASVMLAVMGLRGWILVAAAIAGIYTALGVMAYDRIYAAEVRRAR